MNLNPRITAKMMNMPFTESVQGNKDSLGDTTAARTNDYKGFIVERQKMVLNSQGQEELSGIQIYITGADVLKISPNSFISCLSYKDRRIIAIETYRLPDTTPGIGVINLA